VAPTPVKKGSAVVMSIDAVAHGMFALSAGYVQPARTNSAHLRYPCHVEESSWTGRRLRHHQTTLAAFAALASGLGAAARKQPLVASQAQAEQSSTSGASSSKVEVPRAPLVSDGGLDIWRMKTPLPPGSGREIPYIFFPLQDLLLPGHLKRMHLFEERWVRMVDRSRKEFGGTFAVLYVDGDRKILDVATVVDIVACNNLGVAAGRMITARGVGRLKLMGLSDNQYICLAREMLEVESCDLNTWEKIDTSFRALSDMCNDLDLVVEVKEEADAAGETQRGAEEEASSDDEEVDRLWRTHERTSFEPTFSGDWAEKLDVVQYALDGVPLAGFESLDERTEDQQVWTSRVAAFYAALGGLDIRARLAIFNSSSSLQERLALLCSSLEEAAGLAEAKRAIASAFSGDSEVGRGSGKQRGQGD